jgi:hypothetical protein
MEVSGQLHTPAVLPQGKRGDLNVQFQLWYCYYFVKLVDFFKIHSKLMANRKQYFFQT